MNENSNFFNWITVLSVQLWILQLVDSQHNFRYLHIFQIVYQHIRNVNIVFKHVILFNAKKLRIYVQVNDNHTATLTANLKLHNRTYLLNFNLNVSNKSYSCHNKKQFKINFIYLIALSVKPYKGEPKVGPCHSNDSMIQWALKERFTGMSYRFYVPFKLIF